MPRAGDITWIVGRLVSGSRSGDGWLSGRNGSARSLPLRLIAFGEWCYAEHSVFYDSLPDWFLLFDFYDRGERRFWSRVRRDKWAKDAGLWTVPLIVTGVLGLPTLRKLLGPSRLGSVPAEGVYLRWDEGDWLVARAKLVQPGWVMASDDHWSSGQLKANRLRDTGASQRGDATDPGNRAWGGAPGRPPSPERT